MPNSAGDNAGDSKGDKIKALIFPTRRTEDIGRLNSATVINIEGLVTRVRAIQVKIYKYQSKAYDVIIIEGQQDSEGR